VKHPKESEQKELKKEERSKIEDKKEKEQKEGQKEEKKTELENQGKLLLDATVAPAYIRYPTDIKLLNEAREQATVQFRPRDDQVGKYFGNGDRHHLFGDEFGGAAQAPCFFIR